MMISTRHLARLAAAVLGLALALSSNPCHAQALDAAQALTLFKQGRKALAHQDYEAARAAFAESLRLDPRIGTLWNLADCEEHLGQLALAYVHWQEAIDRARVAGDDRLDLARQRFLALDRRVPRLTITLGAKNPSNPVVRRDHVEVGAAGLGQEIPVDPGHHEVEISADGFAPQLYSVDLAEGGHESIAVELGDPLPPSPPPPLPPVETASPSPPPKSLPETAAEPWNTRKSLALAAAAVGVAGVGVGTLAGLTALAKRNDASTTPNCTSSGACNDPGSLAQWNASRDDARTAATISTVAFIVGGVSLATGAALWLTAKPKAGTHVQLGVGPRALELRGEW